MSNVVLLVFEGRKTEPNISRSLCQYFLQNSDKQVVRASYGFNLYKLWEKLEEDDGLGLYGLLEEEIEKRCSAENREPNKDERAFLSIDDPELISDIYLFFDYDPHCSNAADDKVEAMLQRFDNSQEDGQLLVSYPMVEAIRHQSRAEADYPLADLAQMLQYKKWTADWRGSDLGEPYHNWTYYDLEVWQQITHVNLCRANQLVTNTGLSWPQQPLLSADIFTAQQQKHIPENRVAVLSAFPLMLHNFYGNQLQHQFAAGNELISQDEHRTFTPVCSGSGHP